MLQVTHHGLSIPAYHENFKPNMVSNDNLAHQPLQRRQGQARNIYMLSGVWYAVITIEAIQMIM